MQNDKEKFKENFLKRLMKFSVDILHFCKQLRKHPELWPIVDQLVRSSSSIGANVTEAKSSSSKKDYLKFFEIALKSSNETIYWLMVVKEYDSAFSKKATSLLKEANEIANVIGSSVLTLKGKK